MGYTSNGKWVINGPHEQVAAAWVACRLKLIAPEAADWNHFKCYRVGETGYIRLSYESWKWYEAYPDVMFFESVWQLLSVLHYEDEAFEGLSGKRIRVGEDADDIEQESFGDGCPAIFTSTQIVDDEPSEGEGEPLGSPDPTTESSNQEPPA